MQITDKDIQEVVNVVRALGGKVTMRQVSNAFAFDQTPIAPKLYVAVGMGLLKLAFDPDRNVELFYVEKTERLTPYLVEVRVEYDSERRLTPVEEATLRETTVAAIHECLRDTKPIFRHTKSMCAEVAR